MRQRAQRMATSVVQQMRRANEGQIQPIRQTNALGSAHYPILNSRASFVSAPPLLSADNEDTVLTPSPIFTGGELQELPSSGFGSRGGGRGKC